MEITKEIFDNGVGLLAFLIIISAIINLFVFILGGQNMKYEIQREIQKNKYEIDDSIEKAIRRHRP